MSAKDLLRSIIRFNGGRAVVGPVAYLVPDDPGRSFRRPVAAATSAQSRRRILVGRGGRGRASGIELAFAQSMNSDQLNNIDDAAD